VDGCAIATSMEADASKLVPQFKAVLIAKAFSSEVDTGSRKENA
jgi:hypothetical protein